MTEFNLIELVLVVIIIEHEIHLRNTGFLNLMNSSIHSFFNNIIIISFFINQVIFQHKIYRNSQSINTIYCDSIVRSTGL